MKNSGFTIIELVVVMIIAAIVAAVAVPLIFRGGAAMTTAAMARKIKADIQYTQELAMARRASSTFSQPVRARIIFDTTGEKYDVKIVNDADGDNKWGEAGESEDTKNPSTQEATFTLTLNVAETPYKDIVIDSAAFSATGCSNSSPAQPQPILEFDSLGIPYCVDGATGTSVKMDSQGSVVISKSGETATVAVTQNTGRAFIP